MGKINYEYIKNKIIKNKEYYKMKKEREITIKVIESKKINYNKLAEFFARKYAENKMQKS